MQKHTRKDLKRGMWIVLGNKIVEGYNKPYLEIRKSLFDYRRSPLCSRELQWFSQKKNPYKIIGEQITGMSPLTCKFKTDSAGQYNGYYKHTFRLKDVTHSFNSHSEFIAWRNEFLRLERIEIRELHQEIRKDRSFWKARSAELRHWNRLDDLKRIRKR